MTRAPGVARRARVLIVDDERLNIQLLEVMLEPEGYQLVTAGSGEAALEAVAHHPPDLVLLDIMMPGMTGYQVATRIKEDPATSHIPIVMLSALDDPNSRAHGLSAGAEAFLTKPVNRAVLCQQVRVLLSMRES